MLGQTNEKSGGKYYGIDETMCCSEPFKYKTGAQLMPPHSLTLPHSQPLLGSLYSYRLGLNFHSKDSKIHLLYRESFAKSSLTVWSYCNCYKFSWFLKFFEVWFIQSTIYWWCLNLNYLLLQIEQIGQTSWIKLLRQKFLSEEYWRKAELCL